MDKGYLILAQNNSKDDYVKMAYVLAMSIKLTQSEIKNVTLITDVPDAVPNHYRKVFDQILPIQWYDDAFNSEWKIENRWKLYHLSPYTETVVLDADMLFLSDISHWWPYMSENFDLLITDRVFTYRNELIKDSFYRKTFINNNLPNCYSAFTYFKKTELAEKFWDLVEIIVKDWKNCYNRFILESKPKSLSIDVVFALAVKILGIEDEVFSSLDLPTFTHMKSRDQGWKNYTDNWMDHAGVYLTTDCYLKIGNYQQTGIFHYTEKSFLNNDKVEKYENLIGIYNDK
jgi:hypothetical protein